MLLIHLSINHFVLPVYHPSTYLSVYYLVYPSVISSINQSSILCIHQSSYLSSIYLSIILFTYFFIILSIHLSSRLSISQSSCLYPLIHPSINHLVLSIYHPSIYLYLSQNSGILGQNNYNYYSVLWRILNTVGSVCFPCGGMHSFPPSLPLSLLPSFPVTDHGKRKPPLLLQMSQPIIIRRPERERETEGGGGEIALGFPTAASHSWLAFMVHCVGSSPHTGSVVTVSGRMTFTSNKSMEIEVFVDVDPFVTDTQERYRAVSAFFTYVSLSPEGRPLPVPQLVVNERERKRTEAWMDR
uniref:HotDog ACOT-type domain-containing protein n=1 Tax=Anolis carolinensis TaxID=28377 RepID=A0A803T795_ANOCA